MTFKRIFALAFALLFIVGSAFCVSAETPPFSEDFESEEEMLAALSQYAEEYPYYNGHAFNSNIPQGYHLEYRQVLSVGVGISAKASDNFSFMESRYGYGIDTTFEALYYKQNSTDTYRAFAYYGYNTDEVLQRLENAKTLDGVVNFEEGTANGYPYLVCEYDYRRTDYYLAVNEYLIHLITYEDKVEGFVYSIGFTYTDVCIPVKIKDNAEWFDKTIENGYVIGDANADGELNIKDATALQKYCAKMGSVDKLVADFNGDLKIDVRDATDIQKKLAGLKYTCRRELYPVTFRYRNDTEEKVIESVKYSSGPLSGGELDLILNYDTPDVSNYTTVFKNVQEFEAFFGRSSERFDEEFFKTKALVYLYRFYFSSSQYIAPDSLTYKDGVLHVWCGYDDPGEDGGWQEALANYNIYFEVNKEDIKDLRGIKVSQVTAVYD